MANRKLRFRATALFLAALILPIALAGCAGASTETPSATATATATASLFSGADIMFAQMMIPHHQQAVDMGTLAETRAKSPEVKALAAKIKAEQAPEIAQMKGWLKAANAPLEMGHDMGMGGMLTAKQMNALKNASGAEFDKLYITGMIGHHQGAIHMAEMVVDSNNAEASKLGKAIIASQTAQVVYLQKLLANY